MTRQHTIFEAVCLYNLRCLVDDIGHVDLWLPRKKNARKKQETHADDMGRACLGSEHREDSRAAPDIQHRLVFEEVWIVDDRGTIGARAHRVLQHLLMNT